MSSYYEGLPIYKSAADLFVFVDEVVRGFPRYHKYGLGQRLRDESMEIVLQVAHCNQRETRAQGLTVLCSRIGDMKILVNLGKEVKAFVSFAQFVQVSEKVIALARQAEGWRKSAPRRNGPEPERK